MILFRYKQENKILAFLHCVKAHILPPTSNSFSRPCYAVTFLPRDVGTLTHIPIGYAHDIPINLSRTTRSRRRSRVVANYISVRRVCTPRLVPVGLTNHGVLYTI